MKYNLFYGIQQTRKISFRELKALKAIRSIIIVFNANKMSSFEEVNYSPIQRS